jgi:hypothetical protein
MPTYTAVQDGNWNDPATWGGGGYPDTNADVVVTGAYKIAYNIGVSAITWGNITVSAGGMLYFPVDQDWKLLFTTTGVLTVAAGGEIRTGSALEPAAIGADYKGQMYWPQGSSARTVFSLTSNAAVNLWGSPDFYGGERYAYLESDWSAGQTLYVKGDYSAKWRTGQRFYIHNNSDKYSSITYQNRIYQIASVDAYDSVNDRTGITIVEAAPGILFTALNATTGWQSKLINISRNLELLDPGMSYVPYSGYNDYTERIRLVVGQITSIDKILFKDCMFVGWNYAINGGFNVKGENLSLINNHYAIYLGTNYVLSGDFISNNEALSGGTNHKFTGDISGGHTHAIGGTNHVVTGDFIGNQAVSNNQTRLTLRGKVAFNYSGIGTLLDADIQADFIGNDVAVNGSENRVISIMGSFINNTTAVSGGKTRIYGGNVLLNSNPASVVVVNPERFVLYENCMFNGNIRRPFMLYHSLGNILTLFDGEAGYQAAPSENPYVLQVTPNLHCLRIVGPPLLSLGVMGKIAAIAPAAEVTLTFSIYPVGWTVPLTHNDIRLEVQYLNTADTASLAVAVNTGQTYENDGWRPVSVAFTPAQAGLCYFDLIIGKFESGKTLLIDPLWSIA